jgi:hypothetical protein
MSIHYSHALHTHVAADEFGVVLAIYAPTTHGTLADFRASCRDLVEG